MLKHLSMYLLVICLSSLDIQKYLLYIFFGKMSIQVFCSLQNQGFFFDVELYDLFVYLGC